MKNYNLLGTHELQGYSSQNSNISLHKSNKEFADQKKYCFQFFSFQYLAHKVLKRQILLRCSTDHNPPNSINNIDLCYYTLICLSSKNNGPTV